MKKNKLTPAKFERIIWWSKYLESYGKNRSEFEYIPEKELAAHQFENNPDDRYNFDEDDEIESGEPVPVVVTNSGVLKLRPYNNLSLNFNIWEAQTNFWITEKIILKLNRTEGIEALKPISPYRFRIAAANVIGFQTTRQNIEKTLNVIPKKLPVE